MVNIKEEPYDEEYPDSAFIQSDEEDEFNTTTITFLPVKTELHVSIRNGFYLLFYLQWSNYIYIYIYILYEIKFLLFN